MASPSGAPYGNHDCRDGITAQKMDRGDGKERAVPGRVILAVFMCIIWWCVPWAIVHGAEHLWLSGAWAVLLLAEGFLCSLMLAARGLYTESMKVCRSLEEGSTEEARYNVSMIVGRDTAALDEAESPGQPWRPWLKMPLTVSLPPFCSWHFWGRQEARCTRPSTPWIHGGIQK